MRPWVTLQDTGFHVPEEPDLGSSACISTRFHGTGAQQMLHGLCPFCPHLTCPTWSSPSSPPPTPTPVAIPTGISNLLAAQAQDPEPPLPLSRATSPPSFCWLYLSNIQTLTTYHPSLNPPLPSIPATASPSPASPLALQWSRSNTLPGRSFPKAGQSPCLQLRAPRGSSRRSTSPGPYLDLT